MLGELLGRALAGLIKGLVVLLIKTLLGLLKGLASPFRALGRRMRRRWRRRRDLGALKRDWKAIRKGRVGKGGSGIAKRTRKRLNKRVGGALGS